jgi:hypothetical protein
MPLNNFEIIDDFLPADVFNLLRTHCDQELYSGVVNPADGVLYPGISIDIPEVVLRFFGRPKFIFMRLSLAGVPVPHQAHTDALMGNESLMFYLNRPEHCQGGTALVRHKESGLWRNPVTSKAEEIWQRDTNVPEAWEVYDMAHMQTNRAVLFDANLMHRAEPIGGFGNSPQNGRLVLTAFY